MGTNRSGAIIGEESYVVDWQTQYRNMQASQPENRSVKNLAAPEQTGRAEEPEQHGTINQTGGTTLGGDGWLSAGQHQQTDLVGVVKKSLAKTNSAARASWEKNQTARSNHW